MRFGFYAVVFASLLAIASPAKEADMTKTLQGKKALIIVAAEGFQDREFSPTYELLIKLGATVKIACSRKAPARGKFGLQLQPDLLIAECQAADYDAVVFIGGPGATEYFDNVQAQALARAALANGKILGAICIAPAILARAGVLKGKKATVFPSEEDQLVSQGAQLVKQNVVLDGKIVTAPGPQAAQDFAEALARLLR